MDSNFLFRATTRFHRLGTESSPDSLLEEDGFELTVPPRTERPWGGAPGDHRSRTWTSEVPIGNAPAEPFAAAEPMVRIRLPPARSQQRTDGDRRCGVREDTFIVAGRAAAEQVIEENLSMGLIYPPEPHPRGIAARRRTDRRVHFRPRAGLRAVAIAYSVATTACVRCETRTPADGGPTDWARRRSRDPVRARRRSGSRRRERRRYRSSRTAARSTRVIRPGCQ